ncbi:UNVERIFIED_CONTAM: hypothetical protein GTU68_010063 [Idotea baltica]|nr:hypothetical protein [Idotea baltica]
MLGGKDPYSASKGAAEIAIRSFYYSFFLESDKVQMVTVRAGNVIGGGDWANSRIVPDCFRAWSKKESVEIRSPKATRPWQHVLEPLSGYLRVGQLMNDNAKLTGEAYNFGPDASQNKTVLELLEALTEHWTFDEGFQKLIIHEQKHFHEAGLLKLNCDKALHELQWLPTLGFEDVAEFTASWYRTFYQNKEQDIFDYTLGQIRSYGEHAANKSIAWTMA